ncbi:MAG: Pyridoxamine 5-phosphate oxidase [Segetibacter sp.]|nr:Pyridoxamine 5-phosphate oxidase [Segetibacter sp.]
MNEHISGIRKDYMLKSLLEEDVQANPIEQFSTWWTEAIDSKIDEVNAMTLSTATPDGIPSARVVLLKGFTNEGFIFFTNYLSHKGTELAKNPRAALTFYWKELERQVRIEGTVEKVSELDSDAYFQSRPAGSRIGAWASPQSTVIASRDIIEESVQKYKAQFGENIPRPPHWGGYIVKPVKLEFWQGRSSRLHDRIQYLRQNGEWRTGRLAP